MILNQVKWCMWLMAHTGPTFIYEKAEFMKANTAGYMQKETVSLFCCLVNPKSLCKITRKIPKDSFISSVVCLRAQSVSGSYEALLMIMSTDLCGH